MGMRKNSGCRKVTSFTLVWIKIDRLSFMPYRLDVTSFTLVWIKIISGVKLLVYGAGHELHARVD